MRRHTGFILLFLMLAGLGLAIGGLTLRPSPKAWPHLPAAERPSQGLEMRFMGTSTLSVSDGTDLILIDGYFSRRGLFDLLLRPLSSNGPALDASLRQAKITAVSALVVAHSHFDHALDATPLAKRFKARLMGDATFAAIAASHPDYSGIEPLILGQGVEVGAFTLTPYATPHAPGDIAKGATSHRFVHPARAHRWPMGETYSFVIQHGPCRMLIVPSAGPVGDRLKDTKADVVFLGIGQLSHQGQAGTEAYWRDTVRASGAQLVIPIHWDDFTRPLSKPLKPMPYALDRFDTTMTRLSHLAQRDQVALRLPNAFGPIDVEGLPAGACSLALH